MAAAVQIGKSRFAWRTSSDEVATVQVIVAAMVPAAMTVSQATGTMSGTAASSTNSATSRPPTTTSVIPNRRAFAMRPRAAPNATAMTSEIVPSGMYSHGRASAGRRLRTSVLTPTSPSPRPASSAANTSAMSRTTATSSSRTFAARRNRALIDVERPAVAIVRGGYRTGEISQISAAGSRLPADGRPQARSDRALPSAAARMAAAGPRRSDRRQSGRDLVVRTWSDRGDAGRHGPEDLRRARRRTRALRSLARWGPRPPARCWACATGR